MNTPRTRNIIRDSAKVLKVEDGDVLLIRAGSPVSHQVELGKMVSHYRKLGFRRLVFAVVNEFDDLSVLAEQDMARLGWQRIPGWEPLQEDVEA